MTATFDCSECTDPDGNGLTTQWTVASARTETVELSGETVQHTFVEPAEYSVTLTLADDAPIGLEQVRTFSMSVAEAPVAEADELEPLVAVSCSSQRSSCALSALLGLVLAGAALQRRRRGLGKTPASIE